MRGEYKVSVRNKRNNYSFILRRNITILRGESGRGKSTLYDMIHEHNRYGIEYIILVIFCSLLMI